MTGIHKTPTIIRATVTTRPTSTRRASPAAPPSPRPPPPAHTPYKSYATTVAVEWNVDARLLINADTIAATITPRRPCGSSAAAMAGYDSFGAAATMAGRWRRAAVGECGNKKEPIQRIRREAATSVSKRDKMRWTPTVP